MLLGRGRGAAHEQAKTAISGEANRIA